MTKTKTKAASKKGTWKQQILAAVAAGKTTLEELDKLPGANPDSIRWYACQMTQEGSLKRIDRGVYAIPAKRKAVKKAAK